MLAFRRELYKANQKKKKILGALGLKYTKRVKTKFSFLKGTNTKNNEKQIKKQN